MNFPKLIQNFPLNKKIFSLIFPQMIFPNIFPQINQKFPKKNKKFPKKIKSFPKKIKSFPKKIKVSQHLKSDILRVILQF
jgi:hypothetical protein